MKRVLLLQRMYSALIQASSSQRRQVLSVQLKRNNWTVFTTCKTLYFWGLRPSIAKHFQT